MLGNQVSLYSVFFIIDISFVQIDENVQREIINHRSLKHPNIIRFKEVSQDYDAIFFPWPYIVKHF